MKVRDAIDEPLPEYKINWRDEVQHQRRAPRKEHRIRLSHGLECSAEQQNVRYNCPNKPRDKFLFVVDASMNAENLKGAIPYLLDRLTVRLATGQSDERDGRAFARPLLRE